MPAGFVSTLFFKDILQVIMAFLFYLAVLTAAAITQVTASCPAACGCPAQPPACPLGVSTVTDRCGCCKVCAAQLNQDCSLTRPCDHLKGLECNHGNDVTMSWGICRAKSEGRSCEYSSRVYQNGESFRVGCKHHCTCMDGAVGCTPLCSNKLPPASPSCPFPRLVKVPGRCCFSVDCHKGVWPPLRKNQLSWLKTQLKVKHPRVWDLPASHRPEKEPILTNQLTEVSNLGPATSWERKGGNKHLPETSSAKEKCLVRVTDWSQCSRSCGMGVSSRITNKNPQCRLEREMRLCTVRPCRSLTVTETKGRSCSHTQKAPEPVNLTYGECTSVRLYRPNYCGACTDGRCCTPRRTRTLPVTFGCPDGDRIQRSAMFIQSCRCSSDCEHLNEVVLPPPHRMHGDTFIH